MYKGRFNFFSLLFFLFQSSPGNATTPDNFFSTLASSFSKILGRKKRKWREKIWAQEKKGEEDETWSHLFPLSQQRQDSAAQDLSSLPFFWIWRAQEKRNSLSRLQCGRKSFNFFLLLLTSWSLEKKGERGGGGSSSSVDTHKSEGGRKKNVKKFAPNSVWPAKVWNVVLNRTCPPVKKNETGYSFFG